MESQISLDRPVRNLFAHAFSLLAPEISLGDPMLAGWLARISIVLLA
jgi:hypothetical protein